VTAGARRLVAVAVVAAVVAGCAFGRRDPAAALRARRLMVPVAGLRPADVPDTFGDVRDGGTRRHQALDIPAARGTPVLSTDDGTVLAIRTSGRGGRTVYATDPDRRFVYYYAHLDRHRPDLRKGATIARGQVLGAVGTSGNASPTAPHLHFQVMLWPDDGRWWAGRPIDPRPYLTIVGTTE
jgi:murein DD-endopeptidase MepM/ murein hydrolase activator NlpD